MGDNSKPQTKQQIPPKQMMYIQGHPKEVTISSPSSSTTAYAASTPQMTFTEATTPVDAVSQKEEEEEEELSGTLTDGEDDSAAGNTAKAAAERLAEKRRMKRFRSVNFISCVPLQLRLCRLTHSQTRFLKSEFLRQPHPDKAQRERLSKHIPGLSSRQLQVWFQNRYTSTKLL